jgi:hypothetical protein
MGALAAMIIMVIMLMIGVPCLIVGVIFLIVRGVKKKRGERLRRRGLISPIILLVVAGVMIVPPVGLVSTIRASNNAPDDNYTDTGKIAQYYGEDFGYEPPVEAPYMVLEDKRYTNLALALSDYGDVLVNFEAVKVTKPVANVVTGMDRSFFNRAITSILGGENDSGTVGEVVDGAGPSMLLWDWPTEFSTWPLYCPDVSIGDKLKQYSDDDAYDYFYAVYDDAYTYAEDREYYDSLDEALIHEKQPLVLDGKSYRELTEGLKSACKAEGDTVLIDDDSPYADGERDYAELHIFSISSDELMIREHAVLLMKRGKLCQVNLPYGFDEYSDPQFIPYDDGDEYQLRGAPIPDDIGNAIMGAVEESDIERVDVS